MKTLFKLSLAGILTMMLSVVNLQAQDDQRLEPQDTLRLTYCLNEFPIHYEGVNFPTPGTYVNWIVDSTGSDSTVYLCQIAAYPQFDTTITEAYCQYPIYYGEYVILDTGMYNFAYPDVNGCDSIYHIHFVYLPSYDMHDTLSVTVCSQDLPYVLDSLHVFDQAGVYAVRYPTMDGCDSLTLHFTLSVLQTQYDTLTWNVCETNYPLVLDPTLQSGGHITWERVYDAPTADPSYFYFQGPGVYSVLLDTTAFCPDVTRMVVVTQEMIDTLRIEVCDTELPYDFQGVMLMSDTLFAVPIPDCDTNMQVLFMVHPSYNFVTYDTIVICQNQMPYDDPNTNITYLTPGVVEVHTHSMYGCDSLLTYLTVEVAENPVDTMTLTVCDNQYPLQYADSLISEAGEYDVVVPDTAGGCDIFRHLFVETAPTYHDTLEVTTCSNVPFVYADSSLIEPGYYDFLFPSVDGCDSIITLNLTLLPSYVMDTISFTVCENDLPFVYDGISYNATGTYDVHYTTVDGCDSLLPLHLHVNPILYNSDTLYREICSNELPITAYGRVLTEAGLYTYVTTSTVTGCDSVFYYRLIVHQNPNVQILGRTEFCQGSSTIITASGASTYEWSSGELTRSITTSFVGLYTVTGTDTHGCTSTAQVTLTSQQVTASILGNRFFCENGSTTLTASGNEPYVYQWYDGSTTPSVEINAPGVYAVTVTNALGCTAVISANVTQYALPSPTITGSLSICQGSSTILRANGGISYQWDDGSTQALLTVTTTGTYTVTVTGNNGCSAVASTTVIVNPTPNLTLLANEILCNGQSVSIYAISNPGNTYNWSTGQNTSFITVSPTSTTMYTVLVTDANGCTNMASTTISVTQAPTVFINGETSICQGSTSTLTATGGHSYLWSNGSTSSAINVTSSGTYSVTASDVNGCTGTTSATVQVSPLPNASISGNTDICQGSSTVLTAPEGYSYLWSNNNTTRSITVTTSGNYAVTITNANGCSAVGTTTVTVHEKPTLNLSVQNTICQGETFTYTLPQSENVTYAWSNGAAGNEITVSTTGTYSVTATNQFNCSMSASSQLTVLQTPTAVIDGQSTICQGQTAHLTASGGSSYVWNDGSTQNYLNVTTSGTYTVTVSNANGCTATTFAMVTVNPTPAVSLYSTPICAGQTYTYTLPQAENVVYSWSNGANGYQLTVDSAALYTVTATNAFGCTATAANQLVVHPLPNLQIQGNTSICRGDPAILSASGGNAYLWSNGATTQDIAMYPTATSFYSVTATTIYGCSATASVTVTVKVLPTINFSGNTAFCEGSTTTISVTGGNNYVWSNGSTSSSMVVSMPGLYFVTATNSLGCSRRDSVVVTQLPLPQITISGNANVCQGESTVLTADGASQFVWNTQDNGPSLYVTPQATTIYTVTGTNAQGCSASASKTVTVNALPNVQISGPLVICQGQSSTLTATGGNTYQWSTGSTAANIQASQSGNYTVVATSANGCSASQTVNLTVNPAPVVSISGDATLCENQTQTLTAQGASSYQWSNGATADQIEIPIGGQYSVTGTNDYGCSTTASITVASLPVPFVSIIGQSEYCQGSSTTLYASSNAAQYAWSNGATTQSITIDALQSDLYKLTVTADNGCQNVDSVFVTMHETYTQTLTDEICQGQPYTANGFNLPEQADAGTFTYTQHLQTQFGCDSVITLTLTVNPLPVIVGEISGYANITNYGSYMYTVTATNVNRYEWRVTHPQWTLTDNNVNTAFLQINSNGTGILTAKVINNCGYTEKSITISCGVDVQEYVNETQILIYPNPVQNVLTVRVDNAKVEVSLVTLIDQQGRTLQNVPVYDGTAQINCGQYAAGTYYVRCFDGNKQVVDVRKVIITR